MAIADIEKGGYCYKYGQIIGTATQDIKKGEFITYDMVELDKTTTIYKLRQLQEEM